MKNEQETCGLLFPYNLKSPPPDVEEYIWQLCEISGNVVRKLNARNLKSKVVANITKF